MSSEPNTENRASELFPDPNKPEFEPLAKTPSTGPNAQDGSSRGIMEGFGPLLPHIGVDDKTEQHEQFPTLDQRKGSYYYGVRFWYENQYGYTGSMLKVVCFACGSLWSGTWKDILTSDTDGLRDNTKSYLLPRLAGGGVVAPPGRPVKACRCNVGRYHWNGSDVAMATPEDIQHALEYDRELSEEGARMIEQNGGTKGLLSRHLEPVLKRVGAFRGEASKKAEGTDPPGSSPTPEEPPPHEDGVFI